MIAIVGKAGLLVRGPRFDSKQAFLDEVGFHQIFQVISLQEGWADFLGHYNEKEDCAALGMPFKRVRFSNLVAPSPAQCREVLSAIRNAEGKTYLHCFAGVDRTGFICGLYRHLEDDLTPDEAWREQCAGMGMHRRYQLFWRHSFFERCRELYLG